MKPVRVLMVVEKLYGLGGAQQQALRLARSLGAEGIEASIVTGRWRRSEPRRAAVDGVPVRAIFTALKMWHLKGLRKLGMYLFLVRLLVYLLAHRRNYDVIHVHSATVSAFAVAIAGRWLRKPTVMKVMASGEWSDFRRMRAGGEIPGSGWMARHFRKVTRVICLNAEAEAECRAEGYTDLQRVAIPNGFPVAEVHPREAYALRGPRLIFVGRLNQQKSPGTMLEALAALGREPGCGATRAVFLGDGPGRAALEARAAELGVKDRAEILGRVGDVPAHLQAADVFVLPSLSEGISNALLEAMAHGLPCAATRIPGNTDLIEDGVTGLLVEPGDAPGLGRAIARLLGDESLRARLGRAARRFVEERFDIRVVARRYAELYRELAEAPAPRAQASCAGAP